MEPQIEMIHERGAGEAGEDVAGRILEAAKTRAKLTHMACTNEHCHWRTRALLRTVIGGRAGVHMPRPVRSSACVLQ